jgi:uncharacterized surface protein with fasciclin (FAS1) repeats
MPASAPHEIKIVIKADGKIESTVNGVEGPSCAELTKWLEEMGSVEVDSPTGDFRKLPRQTIINRH